MRGTFPRYERIKVKLGGRSGLFALDQSGPQRRQLGFLFFEQSQARTDDITR
jgi:hypothetical protein